MSTAKLQEQVDRLERELAELRTFMMASPAQPRKRSWEKTFGMFKDDPLFDEIIKQGREYRESQPYPEDVEG